MERAPLNHTWTERLQFMFSFIAGCEKIVRLGEMGDGSNPGCIPYRGLKPSIRPSIRVSG